MNRTSQSVLLASLLAVALAGCSSTKGSADEMAGSAGATSSGASSTAATTGSGSAAAQTPMPPQAQMPATTPAPADMAAMPAAMPNAIVMSIEPMPRPGAVGASGTAGTTSSSTGEDKVYRVTLRMDDGTTRVVTQEKMPAYRTGDRVNMMDGVISR